MIDSTREALNLIERAVDQYDSSDSFKKNQVIDAYEYLRDTVETVNGQIAEIKEILTNTYTASNKISVIKDILEC